MEGKNDIIRNAAATLTIVLMKELCDSSYSITRKRILWTQFRYHRQKEKARHVRLVRHSGLHSQVRKESSQASLFSPAGLVATPRFLKGDKSGDDGNGE